LTTPALLEAGRFGGASVLALAQALAEQAAGARLHVVTRGAQATSDAESPALAQSLVWGLGRGLALEQPELWGGLIDLAPQPSEDEAAALVAELERADGEDQVALRGNERRAARLTRRTLAAGGSASVRADGTYLVTGGLGGLGLRVARWLLDKGAGRVALVGRRVPADGEPEALRDLRAEGGRLVTFAADVADPAAMAAALARAEQDGPPLRGVVHAAGVLRAADAHALSAEALAETLRPKVAGTWVLHELTRARPLDFFVSFSSGASVWGSRGLAHYAAANHFLDAFGAHRRAEGLPASTVNWGPVSAGMSTEEDRRTLAAIGVGALTADEALRALDRLLGAGVAQAVVARVDWASFAPVFSAKARRRLLDALAPEAAPAAAADGGDLAARVAEAIPGDRRDLLHGELRRELATVLGLDSSTRLHADEGFNALGLDSLMAVDLRNRLQHRLGRPLPSTLAFDHPTIHALASYLLDDVLRLSSANGNGNGNGNGADAEVAALEALSDAEVKELLEEELGSLSPEERG
jgi:NAD(P)-dependent dehydrogenase (short-subunit alcohol dehydrogenase family)/acyl carrier protein